MFQILNEVSHVETCENEGVGKSPGITRRPDRVRVAACAFHIMQNTPGDRWAPGVSSQHTARVVSFRPYQFNLT